MNTDRSVASMTTTQLYRKRAFDRRNQRESRARKKAQVESLQEEVTSLKQQLQRSEQETDRLRKREIELLDVLSKTIGSLQGVVSEPLPRQSEPEQFLASLTPETNSGLSYDSHDGTETGPGGQLGYDDGEDIMGYQEPVHYPPLDMQQLEVLQKPGELAFSLPLGPWLDASSTLLFSQPPALGSLELDPFSLVLSDPSNVDSIFANPDPLTPSPTTTTRELTPPTLPLWSRVPENTPPTCMIDNVLLNLVRSCRRQLELGCAGQLAELSGASAFPSVASLLNPDASSPDMPISTGIGAHGRRAMLFPNMAEKVSVMYLLCNLVRWLVSPCKRTYEAMPDFIRPTRTQLATPHPIWVDSVSWPALRDMFVRGDIPVSEFNKFRDVTLREIHLDWPHGTEQIFEEMPGSAVTGQHRLKLTPGFEAHIRQFKNYRLGPGFAEAFPQVKGVDLYKMPD